jgi:hypothetical protein
VGDIRVQSLSFYLEGDVDEAGHRFMRTVLGDGFFQIPSKRQVLK